MSLPTWLPDLLLARNYSNDWSRYETALFEVFKKGFITSKPTFEGKLVSYLSDPKTNNKPKTFWHIITEDLDIFHKDENDRVPVYARCERLPWIRAIIEKYGKEKEIITWKEVGRKGKKLDHTCILATFDTETYLIVLRETTRFFLLWTAYPITNEHHRQKLLGRYESYQKVKTATKK